MGDDVARPAEGRQPAAPVSRGQIARRVRILRAASELGAREGLASVQMHDVAKEAGVAIATLYRYFPSKPYLFMAVLEWHIEQYLGGQENGRENLAAAEGTDAAAEVADLLITLSVKLLDSPLLASAVALSSFTEYATAVPARIDIVDSALGQAILRLLGADEASETDRSRARLLIYGWWGLFVAMLTEEISTEEAETNMRLAARLLLTP
ncbi:TetR/AcrR family transcriptional regulator [Streptomyces sp. N50]|uniref:TetR/AcrR family transcriptional regulator n=1 Tax=Streptomyces sp. N50 TaxID=3081765 RepID=UPI0029623A4E|nr:TetR family transcriptional regulator [Streptomyces sp. N50]WOX14793.1 TetR family transcriptional regulator [Streptomyces sp. N50]